VQYLCLLGQNFWDAVTAIATLTAAYVVWQQLSSLTQQLKIQSDQLKLQHYSEYTKRYQSIVLELPEDINNPKFKLSKRSGEYASTMRHMRAYFDLCFEEWDLHRRKLIDDEAWAVWDDGIATAMSKSAFKQAWKISTDTGTDYGDEFQKFIERKIASIKK
jgi:hypothetical protein